MRKIISFMHISLDGFVAGPNGEMNWITVNQEIFDHIGRRIAQGDSALYGRVTYQMMESYWPTAGDKPNATRHDIEHSKWYMNAQKFVISKSMQGNILPNTQILGNNLTEEIQEIKQRGSNDLLLFGSPTATRALHQLDLIDGYWLFVNPIILGRGISLFADIRPHTKLKLLNSKTFSSGVVELNYIADRATI